MFDRGCRNEGVGQTDAALSTDSASAFRHRAIDRDLPERGKESADQIGGGVARKALGSGDHRVVQSVTAGSELAIASEVGFEGLSIGELAKAAGNSRTQNMVVVGAASPMLDFSEDQLLSALRDDGRFVVEVRLCQPVERRARR